jgi:hypothetical protein
MELGNLLFGNSRGEFPVNRSLQDVFCEVIGEPLKKLGLDFYQEFENDTFRLFPYYWGDCTCGYEDEEAEWMNDNHHDDDCISRLIDELSADVSLSVVKGIYKKYDLSTEGKTWWYGYRCKCTCTLIDKWYEFCSVRGHQPECPTVKHNFWYKPTNLRLSWYKYPLRDSYMNQDLTTVELLDIFRECAKSMVFTAQ